MTPLTVSLLLLLIKSLAVFALAGLTLLALRRASAASRHLVCLVTLCALLALPLFAGLPLSLPVSVPTAPVHLTPRPLLPQGEGAGTGIGTEGAEGGPQTEPEGQGQAAAPTPAPPPPHLAPRPLTVVGAGGASFLLALWLLGVLLAAVRPLLGLWGIGRLTRSSRAETDPAVLTLAADCAALLGLSRAPAVRRGDVPVPITWGQLRPVVLLPDTADTWPDGRLRAVLLHELAHIRRRDWAAHRMADLACALYWFHPLVWLTARRLRHESELACDDLVLSCGVPAPDYARHLLDIARALSPAAPSAPTGAIGMARTAHVEGRITQMLNPTQNRRALPRRTVFAALLAAALGVGTLAALRPAAIAETPLFQHTFSNGAVLDRVADSGTGKTVSPLQLTLQYTLKNQPQAIWTAPAFKDDYLSQGNGVYLRKPHLWIKASGGRQLSDTQLPDTVTTASDAKVHYKFPVKSNTTLSPLFVGVAAGPWTLSVDCPKKDGKVYFPQTSGQVIWTLVRHKHQAGALLMVSDHFSTPSPLPAENDTQVGLHDAWNYERVIYALNNTGKVISEIYSGSLTVADGDWMSKAPQSYKTMQTAHVSDALLRRTSKFRLVARPYEWTKLTVSSPSAKR